MFRGTIAEIDLNRLQRNFATFQRAFAGSFLCPMIKADGYGHGDAEVAQCLASAGASVFGIGMVEEGVGLRGRGIKTPLLLFGTHSDNVVSAVEEHSLTPVLSDWHDIELFEKKLKQPTAIHLKFNTGMNRLGFSPSESEALFERLKASKTLKVTGICSHLLKGEDWDLENGYSAKQRELFLSVQKYWPQNLTFHLFNTGAALRATASETRRDWGARPGIGIYGYSDGTPSSLMPVLSLKTQIVKLQTVKKGEVVSYNGTWSAPEESLVGVLPLGYADGFHRLLSNKAEVLYQGRRLPLVGTVCMDYIMVNLTSVRHLQPKQFDEVTVIGEQGTEKITAQDIAEKVGTISYEVLTQLSRRVPRFYKGAHGG